MDDEVVLVQLIYDTCTQVMSYTFMDLIVGFLFSIQEAIFVHYGMETKSSHMRSKGVFIQSFW